MSERPVCSTDAQGVTGIVLAGGKSSRLGQDKALIDAGGLPLIGRTVDRLRAVVDEVVLVTDRPGRLAFLGLRTVQDLYPGVGVLGGLHAALSAVRDGYGLVVGCDMPFLNPDLLRYMISLRCGYDVIMPRVDTYLEPLHALYSTRCLPEIERAISAGSRRIVQACEGLYVRYVEHAQIATYDPELRSFFNVNEPRDIDRLRALLAQRNEQGTA